MKGKCFKFAALAVSGKTLPIMSEKHLLLSVHVRKVVRLFPCFSKSLNVDYSQVEPFKTAANLHRC